MSKFEDFLDNEIKFTDSKRDCVLKTWDYKQAEIDELRKRNEQAIAYIEYWYGCAELSNIVNILNGDMKWENNQ